MQMKFTKEIKLRIEGQYLFIYLGQEVSSAK